MNSVLLAGGSGFIGSHFHDALPHQSIVNLDLVAPTFAAASTYTPGDIRVLPDIHRALSGYAYDCIIGLAAEHRDFGLSREQYFRTNELGTANLCAAATAHDIRTILFFSSVAVYGTGDRPHEDSPKVPQNDYGASKLAGEHVLEKWALEDDRRSAIVLRPTVVVGARNVANMHRLITQIDKRRYVRVGSGDNVKSIVGVKNVVDASLFLLKARPTGFSAFNCVDEPDLSSGDIAETIRLVLKRGRAPRMPWWLARMLCLPFDLAIRVTGSDLPISTARLVKLNTETRFSGDKLRKAGFVPNRTSRQSLIEMVEWYASSQRS